MKIRSVLLGSVAIAGLTTAGYAADLGVVTSLDVCDALGLSGLTISSDDNCLQISGNISFEYDYGNFEHGDGEGKQIYSDTFQRTAPGGKTVTTLRPGNVNDSSVDLDWWLKFVATADSDFGPATATLKLVQNNWNQSSTGTIAVKEAWVGIGDTTMLMAGFVGTSVFDNADDTPLNDLGLFNSDNVSTGVGFSSAVSTKGMAIQVVSNLGNGLSIGGAIENLGDSGFGAPEWTAIGTLKYAGDGTTAHISAAIDDDSLWNVHAGFTGTFDSVKIVGAIAANNTPGGTMWWNALGSASFTVDMFTLAGSIEATSASEWGVGASVDAGISDGVKLNLAGRYFTHTTTGAYIAQVQAGVSAAVTEAITLSGSIGMYSSNGASATNEFYGKGEVDWNPGGGFTSSASIEAHSTGAYKAVFKAAKSIK